MRDHSGVVDGVGEDTRRSRTPPARALLASVAAIGLLGAAMFVLAAGDPDSSVAAGPTAAPPLPTVQPVVADPPTPLTITLGGTTYTGHETRAYGARHGSDPLSIRILAFRAVSSDPICTTLRPSARVVHEDATSVVIATFAYNIPITDGKPHGCVFGTSGNQSLYAELPIRLSGPLGSRTLFDADSGLAIGFVDDLEAPTPAYVPPGYERRSVPTGGLSDEGPVVRTYRHGEDTIEITARSATRWFPPDHVIGKATVVGHRATLSQDGYYRCVAWSQDPGTLLEVCSVSRHENLPTEELLKVARSLH